MKIPAGTPRDVAEFEATVERDQDMDRVESAADEDWKKEAESAVFKYVCRHPEFFVDDFWTGSGLQEPREARALGPIIAKAARRGWIVQTGRVRPSVRSHMTGKPVWQSLLYKGAA